MTNIEIARLVTAILISGLVGYVIGFITSYVVTWNSATDMFETYKLRIEGHKNNIRVLSEAYNNLANKYIDVLLERALK